MGAYATYSDMCDEFGISTVNSWAGSGNRSDLDQDETKAVTLIVEKYISRAEGRINSVLARKYILPIAQPGQDLKECACVFAMASMTSIPNNNRTTELNDRYTDSKDWLKDVKEGNAILTYATIPNPVNPSYVAEFTMEEPKFMRGIF